MADKLDGPAAPLTDPAFTYCPTCGGYVKRSIVAAHASQQAKGERVFEAVVYAFEGKDVPEDLREHGMVRRALKFRASQQAVLRELKDIVDREVALTDASTRGGQHVGRSPRMQRSMALELQKLVVRLFEQ